MPLVLWAVVVVDDEVVVVVVVEATFCGLVLLLLRAQEVHDDRDGCEDCFERRGGCRRLFWAGCGALPFVYFFFLMFGVVVVKKLG